MKIIKLPCVLFLFNLLLSKYPSYGYEPGRIQDVNINIRVKYNTRKYQYEEFRGSYGDDFHRIYIINFKYRCKKVKDGWFYTIWKANGNERAVEIIIIGKGGHKRWAQIELDNGTKKYYKKIFYLLPWREYVPE